MDKIVQNNLRYERKWIFNNVNYLSVLNKSFNSKFLFQKQYPKRFVNSLYLDDQNYTSVRENLNGVSERKKFRIRWYGKDRFILNKPKLEVKIKNNFLNYKVFFLLNEINNLNIKKPSHIKKICAVISKKINKENLIPAVTTHYERLYLISLNKKIRATIDYKIKGTNFHENMQNPILMNNNDVILEFKYKEEYDGYVRNNLENISTRFSKSSKYIYFAVNNS